MSYDIVGAAQEAAKMVLGSETLATALRTIDANARAEARKSAVPVGGGYGAVPTGPGTAYFQILQFPVFSVAASVAPPATTLTSGTFTASPMNDFRAERLILPRDFAGGVCVTDIQIGQSSQFVGNTSGGGVFGVPGFLFADDSAQQSYKWPTSKGTTPISVTIANLSMAATAFYSCMIGVSLVTL